MHQIVHCSLRRNTVTLTDLPTAWSLFQVCFPIYLGKLFDACQSCFKEKVRNWEVRLHNRIKLSWTPSVSQFWLKLIKNLFTIHFVGWVGVYISTLWLLLAGFFARPTVTMLVTTCIIQHKHSLEIIEVSAMAESSSGWRPGELLVPHLSSCFFPLCSGQIKRLPWNNPRFNFVFFLISCNHSPS